MNDGQATSQKEFAFTDYKGKKILVAVMYFKELKPAIEAIHELEALVKNEPEKSVRLLLDVSDGKIFDETTALWKEKLPVFDKYVRRGAVVGPTWMRIITSTVLMVARMAKLGIAGRVKAFATIEEAREYLTLD
jgi:hypothetical protein